MASIQSQLSLKDGMSPVLKKVTGALDTVLDSFENLQMTAGQSMDVKALTAARSELMGVNDTLEQMDQNLQDVEESQNRVNRSMEDGTGIAGGLLKKIGGIAAAYLSIKNALGAVSAAMTQQTYALRFQALMGEDVGRDAMQWARQTALDMGRAYNEVLSSTLAFTKLGIDGANIQLLTALTNQLAWFTADNDYGAIQHAIMQAFASGNSRRLAMALGLSQNALDGFGLNEALYTGDVYAFVNALHATTNAAGMTSEALDTILAGSENQWGSFRANVVTMAQTAASGFLDAFGPMFEQFNIWLASDNVQIWFSLLQVVFSVLGHLLAWVVMGVMRVTDVIANNLHVVLIGAGVGVAILTAKVWAAAKAWAAKGAAMLFANKKLLAIVGIALAVGAVLNTLGVTAEDVAGAIGAAFFWLKAYLYNTFLVPVWNNFAALGNFFYNLFNDPVASIKILFLDMAISVLGTIQKLVNGAISLLNLLPRENISNPLDNAAASLERTRASVAANSAWVERFERRERKDYNEALRNGFDAGRNLFNNVFGGEANYGAGDALSNWGGTGLLGDIADNTGSTASALRNMSDDLRHLIAIREAQALERGSVYVTVDMSGMSNNVNSNMDLDGMMHHLQERLEEAVQSGVEGVYA